LLKRRILLRNVTQDSEHLRWTPKSGPVVKVEFDTVSKGSGNGAKAEAA
jgi:hypothetical protein